MSIDPNEFWMLRVQEVTRAERLIADDQAGRIVHALVRLGDAVARAMRDLHRRPAAAEGAVTPRLTSRTGSTRTTLQHDSVNAVLNDRDWRMTEIADPAADA